MTSQLQSQGQQASVPKRGLHRSNQLHLRQNGDGAIKVDVTRFRPYLMRSYPFGAGLCEKAFSTSLKVSGASSSGTYDWSL